MAGYGPWGLRELDLTEQLNSRVRAHAHTHTDPIRSLLTLTHIMQMRTLRLREAKSLD